MSNKLPWFTHDHDAHQDTEMRELIKREGHAVHTIYWTLLECLHWHGKGDRLQMRISDFAHASVTTSAKVRVVVSALGALGKVSGTWSGDHLDIEIKMFRERQSKMKFKTPSRLPQDSLKTPIEREGERERENRLVPAAQGAPPKPKKFTPQQLIVRCFKEAKNIDCDDKDWDRKHWNGRLGKEANAILKAFDGNVKRAGEYILIKGEEWADLPDWGLNGVAAAAGRDPRLNGGEENGREDKPLESTVLDGRGRNRGTTSSGEIARDALRSIEHSNVRTEGDGHMDGPGDYFGGDD